MEGIGTNPVMYELLTDMTWRNEAPDVNEWLFKYIERRYGKAHEKALEAWKYLKESVYNCCTEQQGAMESIICARPEIKIENERSIGIHGNMHGRKKEMTFPDIQRAILLK